MTGRPMPERRLYAGIDLGSNSFHMVVARHEHGQLRIIDRIKEMVRLAGGLNAQGSLDRDTTDQALATLARFRERIIEIPEHQVRAVGTATFRQLRRPSGFLVLAETALGHGIEIVSGREEARLVYLGVSQGVASSEGRRMVIDIGGGSTELVAGESVQPSHAESLPFGCVSVSRQAFSDGRITARRWQHSHERIRAALEQWKSLFRSYGFTQVVGSSGTIRAIAGMLASPEQAAPDEVGLNGLMRLKQRMLAIGRWQNFDLPGLSERRRPVIAGGLLILEAVMQTLAIERLRVSPFALREGLLYDLLGRLEQRDPRDHTVMAMVKRYQTDSEHAARVCDWTQIALEQTAQAWELNSTHAQILHWVGQLHEIGLAIAHDEYPSHTAYILRYSDMPGFSRLEQQLMSVVAGQQRGRLNAAALALLPARLRGPAAKLIALLRLAVIIARARSDTHFGDFSLQARDNRLNLAFARGFLNRHSLIRHDLEHERCELQKLGIDLRLKTLAERQVLI